MRKSDVDASRLHGWTASDPSVKRLTPREQEVARLVAAGLKNSEIAQRVGLARGSVSNHVNRIQQRLGLAARAEIVAWVSARATPDEPTARLRRATDDTRLA